MTGGEVLVSASTPAKAESTVAALVATGIDPERIAVVLPAEAERDAEGVRRRAAAATGLVLSGGPDVHPHSYGEEILSEGRLAVQPDRDRLDFALLAGARDGAVPTWGICRGMQVINVFLGGTLWQDVPSQLAGSLLHDLTHPADALIHTIVPDGPPTRTREILGREPAFVNSRHHQAVRELAPGLVVAGRAPDGLVEAVELDDPDRPDWWLRAVQWHPENLVPMAQERALWAEFAAAVRARDADRTRLRDEEEAGPGAAAAGGRR